MGLLVLAGLVALLGTVSVMVPISTRRPQRTSQVPAARPAPRIALDTRPAPAAIIISTTKVAEVPALALLAVETSPRGAKVQLDGRMVGAAPLTLTHLKAGLYQLRITAKGYRPIARVVTLRPGVRTAVVITLSRLASSAQGTPAPLSTAIPSSQKQALLAVGQPAPGFVAKDRVGILYRSSDFRGRNLLLVFVRRLDPDGRRIIGEVNTLVTAGRVDAAVAIVVQPDRTAIREFTASAPIRVPVLFGTQSLAKAYGATDSAAVFYLLSGDGRVMRRQAGRLDVSAAFR